MTGDLILPETDSPALQQVYRALIEHGSRWNGPGSADWTCPAHDDQHASLGVAEGDSVPVVIKCSAGCSREQVMDVLELPLSVLSAPLGKKHTTAFKYTDPKGNPAYVVWRFDEPDGSKTFAQNPVDANWKVTKKGGGAMAGVPRYLYRAPKVRIAAKLHRRVYLCEGEKSVHAIEDYAKHFRIRPAPVATTMPSGASQRWKPEFTDALRGAKEVVIIADNDPAGYRHAAKVYDALTTSGVPARIVRSATDGHKDDVVEHVNEGFKLSQLVPVPRDMLTVEDHDAHDSDSVPDSWMPVDLADALAGRRKPAPTILKRSDDALLFYAGRLHVVYGEGESLKSWVCLIASTEEMERGHNVVYIDFEDDEENTVDRLRCLGVADATIKEHFTYVRPDESLPVLSRRTLARLFAAKQPTLITLDGMTEAMAYEGLSPDSAVEVAQFYNAIPKLLIREAVSGEYLGPAVVIIDHANKDRDGRMAGPGGSQHKRSGISGAMYLLEMVRPFGIGLEGFARISLIKDRPGRIRAISTGKKRDRVGSLSLTSNAETRAVSWSLDPAVEGDAEKPTDRPVEYLPPTLLESVSRIVEATGESGCSKAEVKKAYKGDDARKAPFAYASLVANGYLVPTGPAHRAHHKSAKPYRAAMDGAVGVGDVRAETEKVGE